MVIEDLAVGDVPVTTVTSTDSGDAASPEATLASNVATDKGGAPPAPQATGNSLEANTPAQLAATDPQALVAGLSAEQAKKLGKVFLNRRLVDIRKQNSYLLPTDHRLSMLAQTQGGRPALSEAQKQQLQQLQELYKPRIDAAISDILRRDEEVRRRIDQKAEELGPEGQAEHADELRALQQEWARVRQEMREAKAPIDAEYEAAVKSFMTVEQNQALADIPAPGAFDRP
jgi:hypothetical protein